MIHVLPKTVSDKIAAGEVIDRPASIVKELLENAVDAGASSIVLEIRNGGKTYIRVTDDGSGIPRDQAETAFLRHATSKIEKARDLDHIESLGFRGEALASIAAVTRTTLITKTREARTGCRVVIHGSEVISNEPVGCPDGTSLIVTDLFYNTPARREFLKSDQAESGRVLELASQLAVCYDRIRFQVINNGKMVFATNGKGNLKNTLLTVFRKREYADLVEFDESEGGLRVRGAVSRPSLSRPTRREQIFFVNGRVVDSKVIAKGLSKGYSERLFEGRFPVAFLLIEADPETIDVNIHPNKREVRFHDDKRIEEAVTRAVRRALGSDDAVIRAADYYQDPKPGAKAKNKKAAASDEGVQSQLDIKNILKNRRAKAEKTPAGGRAEEAPVSYVRQAEKPAAPDRDPFQGARKPEPDFAATNESLKQLGITGRDLDRWEKNEGRFPERDNRKKTGTGPEAGSAASTGGETRERADLSAFDLTPKGLTPFSFDDLTVTGSIFDTYILAVEQGREVFYMFDQHAAHERIFYEKLVGGYLAAEKPSQMILTPFLVETDFERQANEEEWIGALRDMGYRIEAFGPATYRVTAVPVFMSLTEAETFANDFIEKAAEDPGGKNTVIIDRLITRSCKSAVKAHDKLSREEAEALLDQLALCRNPFSCPHGRPTFIRFSRYEIEKMFKRIQ